MNPIFQGTVNKGVLQAEAGFYSHLASLEGQRVEVVVRKKGVKRSNQANKYYWGVVVKILSDFTGYDAEEMHSALKQKFLGTHEIDKHGLMKIGSTASLTVDEFIQYTNQVVMWAAEKLQLYIPSPDRVDY